MKGDKIYEAMNDIRREHLLEAEPLRFKAMTGKISGRRTRRKPHGGVIAAVLCGVLAVGIYGGLLAMGAGWLEPFVGSKETDTEVSTEAETEEPTVEENDTLPETVTEEETEAESEPQAAETAPPGYDCRYAHYYTNLVLLKEPTCYYRGYSSAVCAACGYKGTVYTDPLPHTIVDEYCTICGIHESVNAQFFFESYDYGQTATITGVIGLDYPEELILPHVGWCEEYQKMLPVRQIGSSAFQDKEKLKRVVIPDSVKKIGKQAFFSCRKLSEVVLPEGLDTIGQEAFGWCNNLQYINLPDSLKTMESGAFMRTGLREITLPENLEVLKSGCFEGTLLREFTFPKGITTVGGKMFDGCTALTTVHLHEGITSIGQYAFRDCSSIKEISLPDSVEVIGQYAFQNCRSLETFTVPPKVTELLFSVLSGCHSLKTVVLHDDITLIDRLAFYQCSALESIHIPSKVTGVGTDTFQYCAALREITVGEGNPVYHAQGNCLIKTADKELVVGGTEAVIPADGSVTTIGYNAFSGRNILRITIPETVTVIKGSTFENCLMLEEVQIAEGLTELGGAIFKNCVSLTSITLPATLKKVDRYLFEGCKLLETVRFDGRITEIGMWPFTGCKSLKTVYYGSTTGNWQVVFVDPYAESSKPSAFTVYCTDGEILIDPSA